MNFKAVTLLLALSTIVPSSPAWANDETPKVKTFRCGPVFRRPGYRTIDDFLEALRSREDPWRELVMPDPWPADAGPADESAEAFTGPFSRGVKVIHQLPENAIVCAHTKHFRTSPFCSVIFLLVKEGRRFHVADFVRRATGYQSYSDTHDPKFLKLQPEHFVHFYFTEFLGGRKWEFDTDEFYVIRNNRFHRTLLLKNDAAYLSPVDPYREFSQNAEVSVTRGRPGIRIQRSWMTAEGAEPKEGFSVLFHWNARTQKFTSTRAGELRLTEPGESRSADRLPQPPPQP